MEKEGFGEEFSICSAFCFGGIRGGQKTEKSNSILCLYHSTIFRPRSKGVHPRHSPRTFPLGLLAPRCLGLALLLAIARLRAGGSGAMLFGGRKESFPQLRLVSAGLDQPAQPTPFLVFKFTFSGVASASDFCIARLRRRSSFNHGRPSGNARGSNANALDPPSRSRASPLAEDERDASGTPFTQAFESNTHQRLARLNCPDHIQNKVPLK